MRIAITGATGFIGRYIVQKCLKKNHQCRAWCRPQSNRDGIDSRVEWIEGELNNEESTRKLVAGCDAVVHSALYREGAGFRGHEGNLIEFAEKNILGTLRLIEAARAENVSRFVFVSTCAVHEQILDDRPLDECHPLWPLTHYGAHKAAIEKFVHSFGLSEGMPICAVRPTGVYGVNFPVQHSKWFSLIRDIVYEKQVECSGGGKEVHAADVAKAVDVLLEADHSLVAGQSFSCYDRYVSEFEVATLAKTISNSSCEILGSSRSPKHQIETGKIRELGMTFGGADLLRETVANLVAAAKAM